MWADQLDLLACPQSESPLVLAQVERVGDDEEILEATLVSPEGARYPVRDGIPRFTTDTGDYAGWEYKWLELDGGAGHNYRIIDPNDPAYRVHDLFDRNAHSGRAYDRARNGTALDLGCGVGQYTIRLLREYGPARMVAMDLTRGVDVFRGILEARYPEYRRQLLLVQGSALAPPLTRGVFDLVFSLGVLMHTGDTRLALRQAVELVRPLGHLNVWLYASETFPTQAREGDREEPRSPLSPLSLQLRMTIVRFWLSLFRRLDTRWRMRFIRFFSRDAWHRLSSTRGVRIIPRWIFPTVDHPDRAYRTINHYDGYVNEWSDSWSEHEILPVLIDAGLVILGLAEWRLGVWGARDPHYYSSHLRRPGEQGSPRPLEYHADDVPERR